MSADDEEEVEMGVGEQPATNADEGGGVHPPARASASRVFWRAPPFWPVAGGLVVAGLFCLSGRLGGDVSTAWVVWRFTASLSVVAAVVIFASGCAGLHSLLDRPSTTRRTIAGYLGAALVFVTTVVAVAFQAQGLTLSGTGMPKHLVGMTRSVLLACAASVVPWLELVWFAHRDSRALRDGWKSPTTSTSLLPLLQLKVRLYGCVLAFAVLVVIALVPTGALRAAFVAGNGGATTFPSSYVLLYGAFFAFALAAVALPLLGSWRRTARELVDLVHPARTPKEVKDNADARAQLVGFLGLDTGLLRSPLTGLAVLTPLVTSVLAAFVPELAA